MCTGSPGSPGHRAHAGQPHSRRQLSCGITSEESFPTRGVAREPGADPQGTSRDGISCGRMQTRPAGLGGEESGRDAAGTPTGPRQMPRGTGAPARASRHEASRAFIGSGRNPSAALRSLPQSRDRCGAADLPSARRWGCRGAGWRWQGHDLWLGLVPPPPEPSRGVRRCLGSHNTSAKGDPLMQPPTRKPDPDPEGLNLSLSSLRNRSQRAEMSVLSNRRDEASKQTWPQPLPRPGQVRSGDYASAAAPGKSCRDKSSAPAEPIAHDNHTGPRAPWCLRCRNPRLPDFQLRPSPCRPPSGPRLLSATAGHRPQTMAHVCHGRAPCRRCTHAHTHALTGATAHPLRPRRLPSRWLSRSQGR